MIVSNHCRFVYIATPRTGSLSTCNWLKNPCFGGEEVNEDHHSLPVDIDYLETEGFYLFTTVRNPYTRAQSLFAWAMKQHKALYPNLPEMGWIEFLEWLVEELPSYDDPNRVMFLPQHEFLRGLGSSLHIFHFEEAADSYLRLPFVGSIHDFPHVNKGMEPKPDLDERACQLILAWAAPDFRLFGYE